MESSQLQKINKASWQSSDSRHRPDAEAVLRAVAKAFGVPSDQIHNRSHQRAFQVWVYLLRRAANLSLREVADKAGVSPERILQILGLIESENPVRCWLD